MKGKQWGAFVGQMSPGSGRFWVGFGPVAAQKGTDPFGDGQAGGAGVAQWAAAEYRVGGGARAGD